MTNDFPGSEDYEPGCSPVRELTLLEQIAYWKARARLAEECAYGISSAWARSSPTMRRTIGKTHEENFLHYCITAFAWRARAFGSDRLIDINVFTADSPRSRRC